MNPDPPRRPLLLDRLDDAIEFLRLVPSDLPHLLERARQMGSVDPVMREQVAVERVLFREAAAEPLIRTDPSAIAREGEEASAFIETFYLPSGRLIQMRRRYPAAEELDRALRGGSYDEPALWIREVLLPESSQRAPAAVIDAATARTR